MLREQRRFYGDIYATRSGAIRRKIYWRIRIFTVVRTAVLALLEFT